MDEPGAKNAHLFKNSETELPPPQRMIKKKIDIGLTYITLGERFKNKNGGGGRMCHSQEFLILSNNNSWSWAEKKIIILEF